jgi:SEC-C motif-containing protein
MIKAEGCFMKAKADLCPCCSGQEYDACCGRILKGESANTAEQLMRSRYTAYAVGDEAYLFDTWHHSTRPQTLDLKQQNAIKWVGLKILSHSVDADNPASASVEFIARYKLNGKAQKMQELSDFVYEDDRWFYVDGKHVESPQI